MSQESYRGLSDELPDIIHGKGHFLGGRQCLLRMDTRTHASAPLRHIALFLSRLANRTGEDSYYLNVNAQIVEDLRRECLEGRNETDDFARERIGLVGTELKLDAIGAGVVDLPVLPDEGYCATGIKMERSPLAGVVFVVAIGATHMRFAVVSDGRVLWCEEILTSLEGFRAAGELELPGAPGLSSEETRCINEAIGLFYQTRCGSSAAPVSSSHQATLQSVQLRRIVAGVDRLKDRVPEHDIEGIVISAPGSVDFQRQRMDSPGLPGIHQLAFSAVSEACELPARGQNDVDSEISALIADIVRVHETGISESARFGEEDRALWELLATMVPGDRRIIVGYGGGTGVGSAHLQLEMRDKELHISILNGRNATAGDVGHDRFELTIPELRQVVTKVNQRAAREGLGQGFADFVLRKVHQNPDSLCRWCGNRLEFGSLAGGIFWDRLGASGWFFAWLRELEPPAWASLMAILGRKGPQEPLVGEHRHLDYLRSLDAADMVALYREGSVVAKHLFGLQAAVWAAHLVTGWKDGLQVFIEGRPLLLNTICMTHKMFNAQNDFFRQLLLSCLEHDFSDGCGKHLDYRQEFTILFRYDPHNQIVGAATYWRLAKVRA